MKIIGVMLLCLATCGILRAQSAKDGPSIEGREPGSCSGEHHPGDRLTCYVIFNGKPEFTQVSINFNLSENPGPNAPGRYLNFVLRNSRRVDANTYEVTDVLPECYSGTYVIAAVSTGINEKGYRLYSNGYQFHSLLTVRFINDVPEQPKEKEQNTGDEPSVVKTPLLATSGGPSSEEIKALEEKWASEAQERKNMAGVPKVWEEERNLCGGIHKPGEEIACMVSFSGKPTFGSVMLNFGLRTEIHGDQVGMCNGILLEKSEPLDAHTFRVKGKIPLCASGKYRVDEIVTQEPRWDAFNGERVDGDLVLWLDNEDKQSFPDLKGVGEKPPNMR